MSIFEAGMLVCFGVSWPMSVYKTWASKSAKGKSLAFLALVLLGYASGILHKITYSWDIVFALYVINASMVLADLFLTATYRFRENAAEDVRAA